MTGPSSSSAASTRRREKRHHVGASSASSSLDDTSTNSDPLQLLSLAVRVDETSSIRHSLPLLEEPLEKGRLYNTQDFVQALEFLHQITAPPPSTSSNTNSMVVPLLDWLLSNPSQPYPTVALTPVILSGLIHQEEMDSAELLSHANTMRRAALQRLKWERRRRGMQRLGMVLFLVLFVWIVYMRSTGRMKETVMELGYLGVVSLQGDGGGESGVQQLQQHHKPKNDISQAANAHFLVPCASTAFLPLEEGSSNSGKNRATNEPAEEESSNSSSSSRWKWLLSIVPGASSFLKKSRDNTQQEDQMDFREGWAGYRDACYAAEANLWAHFRDYATDAHKGVRDCGVAGDYPNNGCSPDFKIRIKKHLGNIPGRSSSVFQHDQHGPYAMHTIAERDTNLLTDSLGLNEQAQWYQHMAMTLSSIKQQQTQKQQQEQVHSQCEFVNQDLVWLGDSTIHGLVRKLLEKEFQINEKSSSGKQSTASTDPVRILDVGCGVGGLAFALSSPCKFLQEDLPESCWGFSKSPSRQCRYRGISISAAEVWHARTLAKDHGMDLQKVKYDQVSFDDPSLSGKEYSAVVAIESLTYSQNITKTLSVLSQALKPGGILVVVNGVLSGIQSSHHFKDDLASSLPWQQPTLLLEHGEWLGYFRDAGFVVEESLDLGLHYDLPELIVENSKPNNVIYKSYKWLQRLITGRDAFLQSVKDNQEPSRNSFLDNVWNGMSTFILKMDPLMKFLHRWEAWIGTRAATNLLNEMRVDMNHHQFDKTKLSSLVRKFASLRIVQIFQGHFQHSRQETLRKEAHRLGDLTYNMYICRKL